MIARHLRDEPANPVDPKTDLVNHLGPMRAFAMSLTRNGAEADDLVQETLVKAWKNIDSFTVGTNLQAWLFTILRNTFYSARRKSKREVSDPDGLAASRLAVKPQHDGRMQLTEFVRAFQKLPVEQREILTLVGANGYSYEDAAEMCGIAVGTAKSRVNRGRARLAELLEQGHAAYEEMTDKATVAVLTASAAGVMGH